MTRSLLLALGLVAFGSTVAHGQQDSTIKEESPGLRAQATVTPQAARATALARVPQGTVQSAEIEREDGKLVYSFDIKAPGKSGIEEVLVDAKTGKVVSVEHESAAAEAKEHDTKTP